MTSPVLKHPFHPFRNFLCASSMVSLLLLFCPASPADYTSSGSSGRSISTGLAGGTQAYVPPPDSRAPRESHTGGGVRGCGDDIAAIAPRLNAVGQTISTHPTFVWYNFSHDSDPLEFQLYRYQADGSFDTVLIEQMATSQQGYMAYRLPPEAADLTVGETYLWQVVLYCDQAFEEVGQYASAEIEVVNVPVELAVGLPDDALQRAKVYARAGLWYEAIAAVYDATTSEAQTFRQNLLLDLAALEEQPDESTSVDLSAQLRQIAGR